MKIKTINDKLYQAEARLQELMDTSDTKLAPKVTYTIMKNKAAITQALKPFHETRERIAKKYSSDGIRVTLSKNDKRFSEYLKELDEVAKIDVEVELRMIKLSDLGDTELSPKEMAALEFMITDEDEGGENKKDKKTKE